MSAFRQRVADFLVSYRWPLLAVAAIALAAAWPASQRVAFDRSVENMFSPDDPLLVPYRRLREHFGGNEMVLAVYRDPRLLDPEGSGLDRLRKVSNRLAEVDGVGAVLSLSEVDRAMRMALQLKGTKDKVFDAIGGAVNLFRFGGGKKKEEPEKEEPADRGDWTIVDPEDPLAAAFRELFVGYTHDESGTIAAVVCMLEPKDQTETSREATITAIRQIVRGQPEGMVTGEPVMVVDGFRYLEEDGRRLGRTSIILLALTIVLCFRSLRWVLIPVAVVQWSLIMAQAVLVWLGLRLSMVSSMFTATITVVGVATVVHVIVRFRQARGRGLEPTEAMRDTMALLIAPIGWACLTDAVGFASLTVAEVGPVRDFGIMMATGATLVLVAVALLVPGLALLGRFDTDPHRAWGERRLAGVLERLILWVDERPRMLAGLLVLLLAASLLGLSRLRVETDFTKNFRADSPIVRSYTFVEDHLGGAGVWDIVLPAPPRIDEAYLERVERLQARLRQLRLETPGHPDSELTKVISLADAMEVVEADPGMAREPIGQRIVGMAGAMPAFMDALRSLPDEQGHRYLRIMLRARERQPAQQKLRLIQRVREIVEEEFPAGSVATATAWGTERAETEASRRHPHGGEVTGFFVLLANLVNSMIRDQWVCFGVATAGIGLMMLVAFRSPVLALVALVPNALPIFAVLGGMGWLGLPINMGAAMIAAVSIGLSVDSSIHYVISFQRARRAGKPLYLALADVQQTVGRALVFSTLALIVGFLVLCTSNFVPTIYFGALVSISMLGGLLGNLFVLPLLLRLVTRADAELPEVAGVPGEAAVDA